MQICDDTPLIVACESAHYIRVIDTGFDDGLLIAGSKPAYCIQVVDTVDLTTPSSL
jgi:hypothetical protein